MQPDPQRRARWLKTLVSWHWISSAFCLIGLALFAVTGITLNHASQIGADPVVTNRKAQLPDELKTRLAGEEKTGKSPVPDDLARWFADEVGVVIAGKTAEWNDGEIYVSLPRPGGDAWASVDLVGGEVEYEKTDRGWVSWLNDLHKGRNTGPVWTWFIDVFAIACLVFAVTGLLLLQFHAQRRPSTWPLVGLGLIVPVLLALLFIH
jgi:hypothetical protein